MNKSLGTLHEVDLREIWLNEAFDFTRWLSTEENLAKLSAELGMELELEATEVPVGPYKADIVARDVSSNRKVVIENQLEKTDHSHLGQIITYASGLDAKVIIWIAKKFTEEHRSALDFLNEKTGADLQIFGLELKLFQIDDSRPALKFERVSTPNDYVSMTKAAEHSMSNTEKMYLEFWNQFKDYAVSAKTFLRLGKPQPQNWYAVTIGRSNFWVSLLAVNQKKRIGCEIYLSGPNAKKAFHLLEKQKTEIEKATGALDWQLLEEGQDSRIIVYRPDVDLSEKKNWDDAFKWLKERAETFHRIFSPRVKALDLRDGH